MWGGRTATSESLNVWWHLVGSPAHEAANVGWWLGFVLLAPRAQSFSGQNMFLAGEEAWIKWQFTAVLRKYFLGDLTLIYLLLLPKIAVNFVLYSGKCMEKMKAPAVTSQVRKKCWEVAIVLKRSPWRLLLWTEQSNNRQ